jgi:hypothetical protein
MANNAGVYALAVFIVATSITSLDFLEKLAAIFFKNDRYWQYRERSATYQDRIDKIEGEDLGEAYIENHEISDSDIETEEIPSTETKDGNDKDPDINTKKISKALAFEQKILNLLVERDKGVFSPWAVRAGVRVDFNGTKKIFDGIAQNSKWDYVIEVKDSLNIYKFDTKQVLDYMIFYSMFKSALPNNTRNVRGLLIVPDHPALPDFSEDKTIGVLKYDYIRNKFSNREIIFNWICEG